MDTQELLTSRDRTSVHQLSEWGMHQIQAKFSLPKDNLPHKEKGESKITLNLMMVLLYNYQTA
jgi:hypothetical protein